MAKFYITTAIDYVNSVPHLGHAYEKICADVFARWNRLNGNDTYFVTGTDENAQKNELAAKKAGVSVKKFVDTNTKKFIDLCKVLNISYDKFIRTTEQKHIKKSQEIFKRVYEKGDIYKGIYEGLYCSGCEAYLTEKELVDGKCPEHNKAPEHLKEETYFFKMSKYEKKILQLLNKKGFVQPDQWRREMLSRVKSEGLKDLCVCRKNLEWGIDNPIDKDYKIYVWFDALINYISVLENKFDKFWPADVHLVGKGINWFHSVIWPSILLSAGIKLPKTILVHGYINLRGAKLSKSTGNVIDPFELIKKYGADALRYFLIREIHFGKDGDFSEKALINRLNNELANDLGNLVSRVVAIASKFDGKIEGKGEIKLEFKKINKLMSNYELTSALEEIWHFVNRINKYVNEKEPWRLKGKELGEVLYTLLESIRIVSILLYPFIPSTAEEICNRLSVRLGNFKDLKYKKWKGKVKKGEHLFKKI